MRKIFLTVAGLFLLGIAAFSQTEETNGTIYIRHPYVDVVNNAVKAYLAKDEAANKLIYSDTAKYWVSGMEKPVGIVQAMKMWNADFNYYDSIKLIQQGYPDYLHYKDQDAKTVQSWWKWSGRSKKTGDLLSIYFVQFDDFNTAGKIARESLYGDFSKLEKD